MVGKVRRGDWTAFALRDRSSGIADNACPRGGACGRIERAIGFALLFEGVVYGRGACGTEAAARRHGHGAECAWF